MFNSITPINVYPEKIIKYLAFIIVLLSLFWLLDSSSLAGSYKDTGAGSIFGKLEFKGNKITVNISDIPLYILLNEIREKQGLWFKGNKELLMRRISVEFKDLPLVEGIKKIIYPLSYSMVFDSQGVLKGLHIVDSTRSSVIKTDVSNESAAKELPSGISDLDFEQRSKGPPVDLQVRANYKELAPFSNNTGPPIDSEEISEELPDFIPFENDTGPPADPEKTYKMLPDFTPFRSDIGSMEDLS